MTKVIYSLKFEHVCMICFSVLLTIHTITVFIHGSTLAGSHPHELALGFEIYQIKGVPEITFLNPMKQFF